ncbi:MAG TPA: NAD(P)-dependent oxidoreductase [bacterium]|nr:NAD(P)-dependent oxidoreductase [bacterium]
MQYDVAFYEVFKEEEEVLRKYLPEGYDYLFTPKSIHETGQAQPPATMISIRTQSEIPEVWAGILDGIFTRSTGYDHLTRYLQTADQKVPAGYLPKYAARAVAEQAFLLTLMLMRKIDAQRKAMRHFSRDSLTGAELQGKILTVIGVGNIGSELIRIGYGLDMALLGVDIVRRRELVSQFGLQYVPLDTGIARGNVIICALPLTEDTYQLLDYAALSNTSDSSILLNIARGEITPPADLLRLLEEEKLAGVGIDVFDQESTLGSYLRGEIVLEKIPNNYKREAVQANLDLIGHPRVIATPHNAFNTRESTERKARQTARNVESFLNDGEFLTPLPEMLQE